MTTFSVGRIKRLALVFEAARAGVTQRERLDACARALGTATGSTNVVLAAERPGQAAPPALRIAAWTRGSAMVAGRAVAGVHTATGAAGRLRFLTPASPPSATPVLERRGAWSLIEGRIAADELTLTYSLQRAPPRRPFTATDAAGAAMVLPEVARGVQALSACVAGAPAAEAPATLVVDPCHGIVRADEAGRHLLEGLDDAERIRLRADPGREDALVTQHVVRRTDGAWFRWIEVRCGPDGLRAVVAHALAPGAPDITEEVIARATLTAREAAVARLVVSGLALKQVAARHRVSIETVRTHLKRACAKLGVRGRRGLARALLGGGAGPT